jgi:predicted outer membrane repeat protein
MKAIRSLTLSMAALAAWLQATVINIPTDYSTIQAGIDSALVGDTVLVQPGRYVENINFNGQNIVVGSLFLTTNDTSFISQTVIDGDSSGSVVTFDSGEDTTAVLCGFTIVNGTGTENISYGTIKGGGIYCESSNPRLYDLVILDNSAFSGGGIYVINSNTVLERLIVIGNTGAGLQAEDSNLRLSNIHIRNNDGSGIQCYRTNAIVRNGLISNNRSNPWGGGISCSLSSGMTLVNTTIKNNSATSSGGGIWCYESLVQFDEGDRCNIYLNNAPTGSDISTYNSPVIHVVVDTFTVLNPTERYASPLDGMTFDIRYAKLGPVYADLYVAPQGSNDNSGLTVDEPLKTINFALKKIQADSLQSHTIFIAEGHYSPSTNGEIFPIPMKSYVSLLGYSEGTTILDAEASAGVIHCADVVEASIEHITVQNGVERGLSIINSDPDIANVTIQHNSAGSGGGVLIHYYSNPTLMNVTIRDNLSYIEGQSGHSVGGGGVLIRAYSRPILNNVTVEGNTAQRGGGIRCDESSSPQIINSIIRDNYSLYHGGGFYWRSGAPTLDNVAIVRNEAGSSGGGIYCDEANFELMDVTIENNRAEKYGGGIYLNSSTGTMAGAIVSDNTTQGRGGGIYASDSESGMAGVVIINNYAGNKISSYGGGICSQNSNFAFDDSNRCNIYLNRASLGKDLYSDSPLAVIVDTFTVVKPTAYHIYPPIHFTCDILNGRLLQAEADLFVAIDGNDSNSGLSIDDPLHTIDRALARIYADSLNPRSIYLTDGTYSPSTTLETFPSYWISDVSLSGSNPSTTILDAEESDYALVCTSIDRLKIEKISIINAHLEGIYIIRKHWEWCTT